MSSPEPVAVPDAEPVGSGEARSFIKKAEAILNDLLEVKVVTAVGNIDIDIRTTGDSTKTTLKTTRALEQSIVTVIKITDGDVSTIISESLLDNAELRAFHTEQGFRDLLLGAGFARVRWQELLPGFALVLAQRAS